MRGGGGEEAGGGRGVFKSGSYEEGPVKRVEVVERFLLMGTAIERRSQVIVAGVRGEVLQAVGRLVGRCFYLKDSVVVCDDV